ncbi:MAG TPA: carboxypeptidase-like regulatory domain-containing protein [Terriglobales bacterium]|nr:carboxypeptidase-like regulatory domain-containing protein [Terriglobales bacterium]
MNRGACVLLAVVLSVGYLAAQDDEGPLASLRFQVVRDSNGKPVKNAAVVLHPVNRKGKQQRGGMELKTDPEGRTGFDGIPYGPLRVQVLAQGFQTFGEDYDINKPDMEIRIKLKRPAEQYSIYQNHPEEKKDDQKPPEQKPPDRKPQ